ASGQMLVAAMFVAVPLIYTDSIGIRTVPPPPIVFRPVPEPPPIVQPQALTSTGPATTVRRIFERVFRAPDHVPSSTPVIIDQSAPSLTSDPHVRSAVGPGEGVPNSILTGTAAPPAYKKDTVVEKPAPPREPIKVSTGVLAAKLIHRVVPAYPPLAIRARVAGTVRLLGVVAKDGSIQHLQVLSGHPLLTGAALEAVRQWVYRPTLLSGVPVEVTAPIDVIFTLGQ
ncbi:MAG: energy transducer TonB, partial [Bryobacteraceae bacterium]